ncbi:MAG: thioredoxin family protein [Bacteroidota bacterium]
MKFISLSLTCCLLLIFSACGTEPAPATEAETTTPEVTEVAPVETAPQGLSIGDVAPDFELTGTDGEVHSLATTMANGEAAKGHIVVFTCNTCPYAKMYEDRLVALHEAMEPLGYPVVAIQPNDVSIKPGDNMEAMQTRAADKGFGFAYLLDADQTVFPVYGASKTPEVYLLDAERVLHYHGAIDNSAQDAASATEKYVEMAVAALEAGTAPEPAEVKAIGCSIKAK